MIDYTYAQSIYSLQMAIDADYESKCQEWNENSITKKVTNTQDMQCTSNS